MYYTFATTCGEISCARARVCLFVSIRIRPTCFLALRLSPLCFEEVEVGATSENKGTSIWKFTPNSGPRKFGHI